MKNLSRIVVILITFLIGNQSFGQLYAKDAYVFVADNYIFVKGNVNLDTGGNVFLRNESQLLQGGTTASTNTGVGKLSVFQEGTASSYGYGFWSSPVGNATAGIIGNESFGIQLLNRPTGLITSTAATFNHVWNYNSTSNPLNIEPWWIWKYANSNVYAPNAGGWESVGSTFGITPGLGFTMKGTAGADPFKADNVVENNLGGNNQRYDFKGKPNDGNIIIPIGNGKTTLTGNPYPSAIDLSKFLTEELNCTGVAYFWDTNEAVQSHFMTIAEGGYGSYSPVSRSGTGVYVVAPYYKYNLNSTQNGASTGNGLAYQRFFAPVGQGFMIVGNASGPTTVTMKNSHRVFKKEGFANQSQFHKNANDTSDYVAETPSVSGFDYTTVSTLPTPQINFKTEINDSWVNNIVLAFDPNATDGVDHAMDATSFNTGNAEEVYFVNGAGAYVIDVINFDINKRIPIGLRNASQAVFKIKLQEIINFYDADHVYVHDKDNNTYHEITANDSFDVTMPAGDNKTRFEITFLNAPVLSTENVTIKDFDIIQNNFTKNLIINNPKSIALKEVSIYDLTGKKIFGKSKLGNEKNYQFSTSGLNDAVYAVKITTDNGDVQGKKVLIYNKER